MSFRWVARLIGLATLPGTRCPTASESQRSSMASSRKSSYQRSEPDSKGAKAVSLAPVRYSRCRRDGTWDQSAMLSRRQSRLGFFSCLGSRAVELHPLLRAFLASQVCRTAKTIQRVRLYRPRSSSASLNAKSGMKPSARVERFFDFSPDRELVEARSLEDDRRSAPSHAWLAGSNSPLTTEKSIRHSSIRRSGGFLQAEAIFDAAEALACTSSASFPRSSSVQHQVHLACGTERPCDVTSRGPPLQHFDLAVSERSNDA